MPQSDQVDSGSFEISYHSPLHEYISKIGWNSILGHHLRGLQDGVVRARSDVQELLCVELPRLRISLDATLPIGSREALSVILGDLEQAAWSLAESIDGKEHSDLFRQRKMLHGPWESLMHKMNQLERRASFYMVAIAQESHNRKDEVSNGSSPPDYQPITAFPRQMRDRIRAAVVPKRKALKVRKIGKGKDSLYSRTDVIRNWEDDYQRWRKERDS